MRPDLRPYVAATVAAALAAGCATTPLYPPRPASSAGAPIADPMPAKVLVHATLTGAQLKRLVDEKLPAEGQGTVAVMGSQRPYRWKRSPVELTFEHARIGIRARIVGGFDLLGQSVNLPIDLAVQAEPVITSDYQARLLSLDVQVTSSDARLKLAQGLGGALDYLRELLAKQLRELAIDLRPQVEEAYRSLSRPIDLPLGGARGCAFLRVTAVEAGPTVLAGGVEKDVALVVAPQVTLPCAAPAQLAPLPPLANVATLPTGPFTVVVPIAARYDELAKAMQLAFTDGKLYFTKDFPKLYLKDPEVYAGHDQLVLKLRIAGPVEKGGIRVNLDGDIFFAGHPEVVDNELRIPDLQPTIETSSFLLKLKAAFDGDKIRDQAREALRLDLTPRFAAARAKLSTDLALGGRLGCLRSDVAKVEVTALHPHQAYLRVYVAVTAQAGVYLPCPEPRAQLR